MPHGREQKVNVNVQKIVIRFLTDAIKLSIPEMPRRINNGTHIILIVMVTQFYQIVKSCVFGVTKTLEVTVGRIFLKGA
jgi:Na+-transporting NADH:ubiquinone oxidoreductase subunit NqrD